MQLTTGEVVDLPWPLLSPEWVAALAGMATNWQIPSSLVPFMRDLHDLLCLNYRSDGEPAVVLLNDRRESTLLFPSLADFIRARVHQREEVGDLSAILGDESWLDF